MACYNSAVIEASDDQVWAVLRNFHDFSWCPDVIEKVEKLGSAENDQIGAMRVLNNAFHETLVALDDQAKSLRYSIDDGPEPVSKEKVSGYVGQIRVFPITDTDSTFVLWTSTWESSEGGVKEFCDPIYQALLAALKKHFA